MNLSTRNTISSNFLAHNELGAIWLEASTITNITNNAIASNYCGILLTWSDKNIIASNAIRNNPFSIITIGSNGNTVKNNTIAKNTMNGIWLDQSNTTTIYFNNFVNNTEQAATFDSANTWDNAYPAGGNYWSDYTGGDIYSGPYQNGPGKDGIGDKPYVIDGNNKDRYPLINPYGYVSSADINDDGVVDIYDVVAVAIAFGSKPGDPNWNPTADLNNDSITDIYDVVTVAKDFGKKWMSR